MKSIKKLSDLDWVKVIPKLKANRFKKRKGFAKYLVGPLNTIWIQDVPLCSP